MIKVKEKVYNKTPFTREKTGSIQNGINPVWDRSQNFAGVYTGSIPNYFAFTRDRSRHISLIPRLLMKTCACVARVTERCHSENASISFFGLPRFASVPVWDRSSRLHEALTGSIPNWIGVVNDPKLARIADRSRAIPCKRKADPYQFGIDPVLDRSSFLSCKRGLRHLTYHERF